MRQTPLLRLNHGETAQVLAYRIQPSSQAPERHGFHVWHRIEGTAMAVNHGICRKLHRWAEPRRNRHRGAWRTLHAYNRTRDGVNLGSDSAGCNQPEMMGALLGGGSNGFCEEVLRFWLYVWLYALP